MASLIKIGFVGNKTEDIIMYLSRILHNLDKQVAVFDFSEEQLLNQYIPSIDEENVTNYRGVDFYRFCDEDNSEKFQQSASKYNVVLYNFGYNSDLIDEYISCSFKYIVTDLQKQSLTGVKEILAKVDRPIDVHRIFRDVVDCKIDEVYINNLLDFVLVKFWSDYILHLDEKEVVCRLDMQYSDIFKFNKLPKFYKYTLIDIIQKLEIDLKSIIKAFKVAGKGN